jgi:hypothetical protein
VLNDKKRKYTEIGAYLSVGCILATFTVSILLAWFGHPVGHTAILVPLALSLLVPVIGSSVGKSTDAAHWDRYVSGGLSVLEGSANVKVG